MTVGTLGRVYNDGELLVRQGEEGDSMLVIQEGQVEIVVNRDGDETVLSVVNAGEMIGEMAIFNREARSATVRARGSVRALTLDKRNFLARINEDPSLAFRLANTLSKRVRRLSDEVVRLTAELRAAGLR